MKKVFGYTLSTCPWCRKTKQFFAEKGIPFEYVDYDLEAPAKQQQIEGEMTSRGGSMAFPWVLIGDELVVGWNPEMYSRLLGLEKGA